jgi:hypothetical protein
MIGGGLCASYSIPSLNLATLRHLAKCQFRKLPVEICSLGSTGSPLAQDLASGTTKFHIKIIDNREILLFWIAVKTNFMIINQ